MIRDLARKKEKRDTVCACARKFFGTLMIFMMGVVTYHVFGNAFFEKAQARSTPEALRVTEQRLTLDWWNKQYHG